LALLAPEKSMQEVHALLFTGGSAFGLSAATGVAKWLEERGIGYKTPWAVVPIVPAAVIFDLNVGAPDARPDADSGYAACQAVKADEIEIGSVGSGTGATVGKWFGIQNAMKGGFGIASANVDKVTFDVMVVVNAVGDVFDAKGNILAGARNPDGTFISLHDPLRTHTRGKPILNTNTTLAAMVTNAHFSKIDLFKIAQRMHDGFARSIVPVHTSYDGDVSFTFSAGNEHIDIDVAAELTATLTATAIRNAIVAAKGIADFPGCGERLSSSKQV
jgi:L-aminopeptidase/D-esterase-like protein